LADDFDLRRDGTAVFKFQHNENEVTRTLRRPVLEEYRDLTGDLMDLRDDLAEDMRPETGDTELEIAARVNRAQLERQQDRMLDWLRKVFSALGNEPLPEIGLPPWIMSPEVATDLISHWQSVPSRRGGK